MIDIPLGKAIAPEENTSFEICAGCYWQESMKSNSYEKSISDCRDIACNADNRKDGKNVIFKQVDYSEVKP